MGFCVSSPCPSLLLLFYLLTLLFRSWDEKVGTKTQSKTRLSTISEKKKKLKETINEVYNSVRHANEHVLARIRPMGIVVVIPLYCSAHKAKGWKKTEEEERSRREYGRMVCWTSDAVTHNLSSLTLDKSSSCGSASATTLLLIVAWQKLSRIHRQGTKAALRLRVHGRSSSTLVRWVTGQRARNDCTVER